MFWLGAGTDYPKADWFSSFHLQSNNSIDYRISHSGTMLRFTLLNDSERRGSVDVLACQQPLEGERRLHTSGNPDDFRYLQSVDDRFGARKLKHLLDFSAVKFSTDDCDSSTH